MKILLIHDTFFTLESNLSCIRKLICGRLCWFMLRFLCIQSQFLMCLGIALWGTLLVPYVLFVFEINLSCSKELICGGLC